VHLDKFLDLEKFLFHFNEIKKINVFDAKKLLDFFSYDDLCFEEDINILCCLYDDRLNFIRTCTIFNYDEPLLSLRRKKLKSKIRWAKSLSFYFKEAYFLIKECQLSFEEYEAFLWLRLAMRKIIPKEQTDAYAIWIVILNYLLFHKMKNLTSLCFRNDKILLDNVVKKVFVKEPDFSSIMKAFSYLLKRSEKNEKAFQMLLSLKSFERLAEEIKRKKREAEEFEQKILECDQKIKILIDELAENEKEDSAGEVISDEVKEQDIIQQLKEHVKMRKKLEEKLEEINNEIMNFYKIVKDVQKTKLGKYSRYLIKLKEKEENLIKQLLKEGKDEKDGAKIN